MARRGVVRDFLRELADDGDGRDEGLVKEVVDRVRDRRTEPEEEAVLPAPDPPDVGEAPSAEQEAPPVEVVEAPSAEQEAPPVEVVEAPSAEQEAPPVEVVEAPSAEQETPPVEVVEAPSAEQETPPVEVVEAPSAEQEAALAEAAVALDPAPSSVVTPSPAGDPDLDPAPLAVAPPAVSRPRPERPKAESSADDTPPPTTQLETGVAFRDAIPAEFAAAVSSDLDGDGLPDRIDADTDSDGLVHSADDDPDQDTVSGTADRDTDGDGFSDDSENIALAVARDPDGDLDGDGVRNEIDPDVDNDGTTNLDAQRAVQEAARTVGTDSDRRIVDVVTSLDRDNDLVVDADDIDVDGDGKIGPARGVDFDEDDARELAGRAGDFVKGLVGIEPEPTDLVGRALAAGREFVAEAGEVVRDANDRGQAIRAPGAPRDALEGEGLDAAKSDLDGDGTKDVSDRNRDNDRFDDDVDLDDDNDGVPDTADPDSDNDGFFDDSEATALAEETITRPGLRLSGGAKLLPADSVTSEDVGDLSSLPGGVDPRFDLGDLPAERARQVPDVLVGPQSDLTLGVDGQFRDDAGRTFDAPDVPFDLASGEFVDSVVTAEAGPIGEVGGMLFDAAGNLVDIHNRLLVPVDELLFDADGNVVSEEGEVIVPVGGDPAVAERPRLTFRGDRPLLVDEEGNEFDVEANRGRPIDFRPSVGDVSAIGAEESIFVDGFGNLVDESGERIGDVGSLFFDEDGSIVTEDGAVLSQAPPPDDDFGSGAPSGTSEPLGTRGSQPSSPPPPFTEAEAREAFDDTVEALSDAAESTFGGFAGLFGLGDDAGADIGVDEDPLEP